MTNTIVMKYILKFYFMSEMQGCFVHRSLCPCISIPHRSTFLMVSYKRNYSEMDHLTIQTAVYI